MTLLLPMRHLLLPTIAAVCVLAFADLRAEDAKPASDRERLRGTWYVVRIEHEGVPDPKVGSHKLVITDKMMTLSGFPDTYELNEKSEPKQLDAGFFKGIYKLEGDNLTYCRATASSAPRPTKFATTPEGSAELIEFRRSPLVPADAPEKDFDKQLKSTIKEAAKLLEAKRDADLLKLLMPPAELKKLDAERQKEILGRFDPFRVSLINAFRVLPKLKPDIKKTDTGTIAVFDLTRVHIPDGPEVKSIVFVKIDDNWYLVENEPDAKQ